MKTSRETNKLIYDKITLIYCVKNEFNLTSEVQNIENGIFQKYYTKSIGNCNHHLENVCLQMGHLKAVHFEMPCFPCSEFQRFDLTHLCQNYINLLSKMRLIQPLKFRTLKTGCFKMPHLQMAVFQTGIMVASWHFV